MFGYLMFALKDVKARRTMRETFTLDDSYEVKRCDSSTYFSLSEICKPRMDMSNPCHFNTQARTCIDSIAV